MISGYSVPSNTAAAAVVSKTLLTGRNVSRETSANDPPERTLPARAANSSRELQGKDVGDSLEVKLEPEDAFGEYDAELVAIESRQLFPDNIEVGMQFERGAEDGDSDDGLFTITDIADEKVVVDGNHPLAGIALLFSCTVTDVRAATTEEISHGHIHGEHGHQH